MNGDEKVHQVEHGRFCGVNFLRQVRFAENLYAVAVPRAAIQIASARKLPCPVQLCANVLVLVR